MAIDNKSTPTDEELVISTIQLLAGKTKADANPDELETLKKLIKKNVPFSLRGYFMAYLLREVLQANAPRKGAPKPIRTKREIPVAKEKTTETAKEQPKAKPARTLPEGSRTLYLNIGKMKRLYTKELSLILQTELGITREDIYSIRIHDKYSFISMNEENCEKAIAKLNGMDIRGRTASVSYSNKE